MTATHRRDFLKTSATASVGIALANLAPLMAHTADKPPLFRISCTEYSLHRMIRAKKLDHVDFAPYVKKEFDIDAVEYWNRPFFTKALDKKYIGEMRKKADDAGVKGTVILVDGEGKLGNPKNDLRARAVDNHRKWIECAKELGCHSIRVNAHAAGSYEEQVKLAADGLRRLSEFAGEHQVNVIVENHGGLSSNGEWLAKVMETVSRDNCGTLPDFGNFHGYDRYKGVKELMPYAKLVSAKSHDFDDQGNETRTDYMKMMKIVLDAGYHDCVGIEYEGRKLGEVEGVHATKKLLERVRDQLATTH